MLKTADVEELLVPILIDILGQDEVNRVTVRDKIASDGDPVIEIEVEIPGGLASYDPYKSLKAQTAVNIRLTDEGDPRLVMIRPIFPGDEPGIDDDTPESLQ